MEDFIIKSNRTCRDNGAIGKDAIVPKWIAAHCENKHFPIVLDFGAGKKMKHVHSLRTQGFSSVSGYEFGENVTDDHIKVLRPKFFHIVYASNVFNTHSNALMSAQALHLIKNTLVNHYHFVFNLPNKPNYFWTNRQAFLNLVTEVFGVVPTKVDSRHIYMVRRDIKSEEYLINV